MITLRPMRNRDMVKQAKYQLPKFYGVVVQDDGRDIGSGSVVFDEGRAFLCLEITPELRQKPQTIVKVAKKLIEGATKSGELFTVQNEEEPTSERFLHFLGFRPTGEMKNGAKVLAWQR